jgi:2-polyprenyl-3-methyl-5-hydroxy-6-metoxy-1,4-benzoquinol methylase
MTDSNLEFTGERMVPGKVDSILLREHVARYRFALEHAEGKKVLDVACGVGYGSYILAAKARNVVGLDISKDAIDFAKLNYSAPNMEFTVSDVLSIPFDDKSFDLIVAFEIFEHLADTQKFLNELKRVYKDGGMIILSTPNRDYPKSTVENPFHLKEYDLDEFTNEIRNVFPGEIEIFGQFSRSKSSGLGQTLIRLKRMLGIGPILKKQIQQINNASELMDFKTDYEFSNSNLRNAEFFIAVIKR